MKAYGQAVKCITQHTVACRQSLSIRIALLITRLCNKTEKPVCEALKKSTEKSEDITIELNGTKIYCRQLIVCVCLLPSILRFFNVNMF